MAQQSTGSDHDTTNQPAATMTQQLSGNDYEDTTTTAQQSTSNNELTLATKTQ
jgi:hypothetical protein